MVVAVGPVHDRNGHVVPDGTVVDLYQELSTGDAAGPAGRGTTKNGLARITVDAGASGGARAVILRAGVNGYRRHDTLRLTVAAPTPEPRPVAAPVGTVAATATRLGVADLMMCLASIVVVGAAWVASPGWRRRSPRGQLRTVMFAAGGGLLAYLFYGSALLAGMGGRPAGLRHGDAAAVGLAGAAGVSLALAVIRRRRQ